MSASTRCYECFKRSHANRSGRSRCSGGNPCKSCERNNVACNYDYHQDNFTNPTATPPSAEVVSGSASTRSEPAPESSIPTPAPLNSDSAPVPNTLGESPSDDTSMFVMQHSNGSVKLRFVPDPEKIGTVDPYELGEDNLDPYVLPSENYKILVNAFKRKQDDQAILDHSKLPLAKRIRGGLDQAIDNAGNEQEHFANPPPHQEDDQVGPAAPERPNILNNLVESSTAAILALTQVVSDMKRDNLKQDDDFYHLAPTPRIRITLDKTFAPPSRHRPRRR